MEWDLIRPLLEDWAEVATFDTPGVGEEPPAEPPGRNAVIARILAEIERRGWERCFLVADSFAVPTAAAAAAARPEAVEGLALGHPALSYPVGNEELYSVLEALIETDFSSFIRAGIVQLTGGSYDEALLERALARVPQAVARRIWVEERRLEFDLGATLRELAKPLLLAEHDECIAIEPEIFAEAAAAFPEAATVTVANAPATDPGFAAALRDFCSQR